LLNIAYGHLRARSQHGDCTQDKCVDGCGFLAFTDWLESPVLRSDELADERRQDRLAALMRGEVPA
jgi:hypothetical protein